MRGEKLTGGSRGVMFRAWGGCGDGSEPCVPHREAAEPSIAHGSRSLKQGMELLSNSHSKCLQ